MHSGGFVIGSLETEHHVAATLAASIPAVVVSIQYNKAPEFPHPTALDDVLHAVRWVAGKHDFYCLDINNIGMDSYSNKIEVMFKRFEGRNALDTQELTRSKLVYGFEIA